MMVGVFQVISFPPWSDGAYPWRSAAALERSRDPMGPLFLEDLIFRSPFRPPRNTTIGVLSAARQLSMLSCACFERHARDRPSKLPERQASLSACHSPGEDV